MFSKEQIHARFYYFVKGPRPQSRCCGQEQFCLRTGRCAAARGGHGEGHVMHFAVPSVQE